MKTVLAAVGIATALAACGGDDDDGNLNCSDFSACGGDPVGEWTIVDACFDDFPTPEIENCPTATASVEDVVVTGSVEIRDDGSYATQIDSSATIVITVPKDCLDGATCAQLSDAAGVDCAENGDVCDCMQEADDQAQETGSWEADGSTITLTSSEGDVDEADFCAQGDVLKSQSREDADSALLTLVMTR